MRDTTDKEKELESDLFLDIDGGIARGITMILGAYEHCFISKLSYHGYL